MSKLLGPIGSAVVLLAVGGASGCMSGSLQSTSCQSAADCASGQVCGSAGVCVASTSTTATVSGSAGSGTSKGATSASGEATAASTTGAVSVTTGSNATAGGSASSTGTSAGCGCSAACCSEQATASSTKSAGALTCPNGKSCYGSYYCSLSPSGGCTANDPCNGQSGVYTACTAIGTTTTGGAAATSGSMSSSSSSGTTTSGGANGGGGGAIGPAGGQVDGLVFAVVGDSRPANENDASGYPTAIIAQIFTDLEGASPKPQFAITTGDYAYCSTQANCNAQTSLYMTAAKSFTNQIFPAMGNHECNGYTSSDCGPNNTDGITGNYANYLSTVLGGFGISSSTYSTLANQGAYYAVNVSSSAGVSPAWTAKFVVIAANAWDSTQAAWLTSVMGEATTYTFVVRHESQEDETETSDCPGDCGASDTIINAHPYTLLLVGHTHEYKQSSTKTGQPELIVGNGGAPVTSGVYGYTICSQLSNGNISCQPYDYTSGANGNAVLMNAAGVLQ